MSSYSRTSDCTTPHQICNSINDLDLSAEPCLDRCLSQEEIIARREAARDKEFISKMCYSPPPEYPRVYSPTHSFEHIHRAQPVIAPDVQPMLRPSPLLPLALSPLTPSRSTLDDSMHDFRPNNTPKFRLKAIDSDVEFQEGSESRRPHTLNKEPRARPNPLLEHLQQVRGKTTASFSTSVEPSEGKHEKGLIPKSWSRY